MAFRLERFTQSLDAHVRGKVRERLLEECRGFGGLNTPAQKAKWVKGLMDALDGTVEEGTRQAIMEQCGRNCISTSTLSKAKGLMAESADLDQFLDKLNQAHIGGGKLHREGSIVHASYERCYCGTVSATREPISATYCACSCGWYKQLFESTLGRPVQVELLASIVQGAESCRFVICILES